MNINDASSRGQVGALLGDSSRKDEVKRLAQGVAAEYFGAGKAQQPQNGNFAYVDTARISDEAIQEISGSAKAGDIERTDQLVNALREAYAGKAPDGAQQGTQHGAQQGEGGDGPEGPGAADGGSPGKKMQKKRTVMWEPLIEAGQIHPEGREVIGKITIKEDVQEVDAPGNAATNSGGGSGGQAGGGAGAPTSSSPNSGNATAVASTVGGVGKGQSSGNSAAQGNKEVQKKMDEEGEADKGSAQAAANMKSAGVAPPPEMEQGAGNYEKGEKSKEMEVRTAATGATQTVSVTPAGDLSQGDGTLRRFKKLDDSPLLKSVSLHSKGERFDRTADMYAMEAMKQGESGDQVVQQTEALKKTNPDQ